VQVVLEGREGVLEERLEQPAGGTAPVEATKEAVEAAIEELGLEARRVEVHRNGPW